MGTQTRTWQRKVIEQAKTAGDLPRLFWFIEMDVPAGLRPSPAARYMPATYPPGFVPVIPAGPDPDVQREYAEILCAVFETANRGRMISFAPTLTDTDLLSGFFWYEYGEQPRQEIDHVCPYCGSISRAPVTARPACTCIYSEALRQ